ncbi:restriction endonuclease subunit S [Pontiella desulfatans]|nr:restriction endonuclease subunit S [Pontiella desulfatans]
MSICDIAEIRAGYAFRSKIIHDPDGNVCVIQPRDLSDDGRILDARILRVVVSGLKKEHLLKAGDVLVSTRGRFASAVFSGQCEGGCVASGSLLVVRVKPGKAVLPAYLSLYFNSAQGRLGFNRLIEQSSIPYVSRNTMEHFILPVPDLGTQQELIDLEQSRRDYARLTARKLELLDGLINHHLTAEASAKARLSTIQ